MRLLYQNLRSFYKSEKFFFIMLIITIFFSTVIMLFSYGLYNNYKVSKLKYTNDQTTLIMSLSDSQQPENMPVTKYEIEHCLSKLSANTCNRIKLVWTTQNIDNLLVESRFRYSEHNYMSYPETMDNIRNSGLYISGRYFSESEYQSGERVLIAGENYADDSGKFLLQGENFRVISVINIPNYLEIAFTALKDDTTVSMITFLFEYPPTSAQYTEICDVFRKELKERVTIHEMEPFYQEDYAFYNTIIIVSILIAIVAAANIMILYNYVLMKRKRTLSVFMICGCSKLRAAFLFLCESLIVSIPCFFLSALIYHKFFLRMLALKFPYIAEAYSLRLYFTAFLIYIGVCGIGMFILCNSVVHRYSIAELKTGGVK